MTGFNHALTGAVIGLAIQNPILVAPAALLSHFLLDMLPHFGGHPIYQWGHKHFPKVLALDALLCVMGIGLAIFFAPKLALPILLGAAFAMLPDLSLIHYYTKGKPHHWFHKFHLGIQWFERPPGLLVEASYLAFISVTLISLI